jgi:hypothetical protein
MNNLYQYNHTLIVMLCKTGLVHPAENWYSRKSVLIQHWYDPHNLKNSPKQPSTAHQWKPKKLEINSNLHITKTTTIEKEMLIHTTRHFLFTNGYLTNSTTVLNHY